MPIAALFDINLDGEDHGYEAENAETILLSLRDPSLATTVVFQVYNPGAVDPSLGIAANPPRSSKGAPTLTLEGATSGQAVSPLTVDGAVSCELPGSGSHSWIVRCVVNGGRRQLPNGATVVDPALTFERGVWIPTANGARKVVITESTQFELDGWAGALADFIGAPGALPDPFFVETAEVGMLAESHLILESNNGGIDSITRIRNVTGGMYEQESSVVQPEGTPKNAGHSFSTQDHLTGASRLNLLMGVLGADATVGFFGAAPVVRQSITGVTTQEQIDSLVAALVAFGLVTDDR